MSGIRNIKLVLEYDGTRYHGWQRQKTGPTIQAVLEDRIQAMTGESVTVHGSGRTDAGVHALHQVCHFTTHSRIDPDSMKKGLNALLPRDLHIKEAREVPLDFHSRYGTRSKTYEYRILNREEPDIFRLPFVWHIRGPLNTWEMRQCLSLLPGEHDFSSFMSTGSKTRSPVRTMLKAELLEPETGLLLFRFEANGFLRHMVRNIIGSMVDAGRGKIGRKEFKEILDSRDRTLAGVKAPAQGLFLVDVKY